MAISDRDGVIDCCLQIIFYYEKRCYINKMKKQIFGNGFETGAVGLGCMGFSHAYGVPTD